MALASDDWEHRAETRVRHAHGGWRWHEVVVRNLLNHPAVGAVAANTETSASGVPSRTSWPPTPRTTG